MNLPLNHFQKLNLKHNPFSILNEKERLNTFTPLVDLEFLVNSIKKEDSFLVSFYGKKGQGKSINLSYLVHNYLNDSIFYQPKIGFRGFINTKNEILVIDSFQLLSNKNKWHLLRYQKRLIIGFHFSFDIFKYFGKLDYYKGINFNHQVLCLSNLEMIVKNRIQLAQLNKKDTLPYVTKKALQLLINKHQNNLRAIFSDLYDEFQNKNINPEMISF